MHPVKKSIMSVMHSPSKNRYFLPAFPLYMISRAYAGIQKMRQRLYRSHLFVTKQLPCKVISIGNITVGGTGKTPMTISLAQRLDRL
jgi:tetraacyldisaccharide 4'-kinase